MEVIIFLFAIGFLISIFINILSYDKIRELEFKLKILKQQKEELINELRALLSDQSR